MEPQYNTHPYLFDVPEDIEQLFNNIADNFLDPKGWGREVTLIFDTTNVQTCPNCLYNPILGTSTAKYNTSNAATGSLNIPFSTGLCPVCRGKGKIENQVPKHDVINMLVIPSPVGGSSDEFEIVGSSLDDIATKYYAIGFFTDKNNIERCNRAIMRGDTVKRIGPVTPIGLRSERYIETYWEKII